MARIQKDLEPKQNYVPAYEESLNHLQTVVRLLILSVRGEKNVKTEGMLGQIY